MQKDHITVCVCTFKRPLLFGRLLAQLQAQACQDSFRYSIVAVDNDKACSARAAVERAMGSGCKSVEYIAEPRQNIARARNLALAHARGNLIVFIDDDELPGPDWLLRLYQAYKRHGGAGVCGPVEPRFAVPMPAWAAGHPYFFKPQHAEGASLSWWQAHTSNVLFDRRLVTQGHLRFDERFGRSGGEDIMFFRAAQRRGYRFSWASAAKVTENVLPEKTSLRWVARRALRQGAVFARISVQDSGSLRRFFFIAQCCVAVWFYAGLLFAALISGARARAYVACKLLDNCGKIAGLLGYVPVEYGSGAGSTA